MEVLMYGRSRAQDNFRIRRQNMQHTSSCLRQIKPQGLRGLNADMCAHSATHMNRRKHNTESETILKALNLPANYDVTSLDPLMTSWYVLRS